jgi:hypothetical protein
MKQTAVEWFNQQIVDRQNGNGDARSWDEIFNQANEMFKQQIIDAYNSKVIETLANEYYNETFNK